MALTEKISQPVLPRPVEDPWWVWFIFFSSTLIFVSLFIVSASVWHLGIAALTICLLWWRSPTPLKTLGFILGLVLFLALLQVSFSPFMRGLFFNALEQGFHWSDWKYLLFATERFAWPLVIVTSFQSRLTNPATLAQLTRLLSPLKWLGIQISKLQILVILSLRFIPALKLEWERFSRFQTYFISGSPRQTYRQKLTFWAGVFKAMISHTIHRGMTTGDLLAIRGMPNLHHQQAGASRPWLFTAWLGLGTLFFVVDIRLGIIWAMMSTWLSLVTLADRQEIKS